MFQRYALLGMTWLLFAAQGAPAQNVTVEVAIEAVKPEVKEITVNYKTNLGNKSITLDVSRKAEITLNGDKAELESLGRGQKASVEYNRELEIVTKVDATGTAIPSPRLVHIAEIEEPWGIWLAEDGLTIYYERRNSEKGTIYTAHRKDAESLFENRVALFPGSFPTLTGDRLEMVLMIRVDSDRMSAPSFFSATRDSVEDSFRRPKPIPELRNPPEAGVKVDSKTGKWSFLYSMHPCFSTDGLTLYFNNPDKRIVCVTRTDRQSPWGKPNVLKVNGTSLFSNMMCPFVTEDGLTLFCVVETQEILEKRSNLLKFKRFSPDAAFGQPEFVEIEGVPKLMVRWPRYVPATRELFLVQYEEGFRKSRLIAIKNYVP